MKHAYLVMAHTNFSQLQTLINCLDDERNDIYLHIDKKAKDFSESLLSAKLSKLIYVDRMSVNWAACSQMYCELSLLKAATSSDTQYSYYHLISGLDLPIKTQDCIHSFFETHAGEEYIHFVPEIDDHTMERVKYWWLFQDAIGKKQGFVRNLAYFVREKFVSLQRKLKYERKHSIKIYKGTQWFSITDDLAKYVVSQESFIKKEFSNVLCVDEIFLQSISRISPCAENIVNNSLREIRWGEDSPFTYTMKDFDMLMNSENLFARKFDSNVDEEIIEKITSYVVS